MQTTYFYLKKKRERRKTAELEPCKFSSVYWKKGGSRLNVSKLKIQNTFMVKNSRDDKRQVFWNIKLLFSIIHKIGYLTKYIHVLLQNKLKTVWLHPYYIWNIIESFSSNAKIEILFSIENRVSLVSYLPTF